MIKITEYVCTELDRQCYGWHYDPKRSFSHLFRDPVEGGGCVVKSIGGALSPQPLPQDRKMANQVQIKSISHWHEQIVDWMLANPHLTLGQCAAYFNKTQNWLSAVIHTDLFQAYKARRFQEHQEHVSHSVITRVNGLAGLSLEVLQERIEKERETIPLGIVKDSAELTLKACGFGPKQATSTPTTVNLNVNSVSATLLAEAREDLRQLHQDNASPVDDPSDSQNEAHLQLPLFGDV